MMKFFYSLVAFLLITVLFSANSYAQLLTIDEHLEQPLYLEKGVAPLLRLEPKAGVIDDNIIDGGLVDLAGIYEASKFRLRIQLEYKKAKLKEEAIQGNFRIYIKGKLERVDEYYGFDASSNNITSYTDKTDKLVPQPSIFAQEFELEIHQTLDASNNYQDISQTLLDYSVLGIFKKEDLIKIGTETEPGYKTAIWIQEIIVENIDTPDPNNDVFMLSIIPEAMPEYGRVGDEFAPTLENISAIEKPFIYDAQTEQLEWNRIKNAHYYEVEWVFVDFYDNTYDNIGISTSEEDAIIAAQNAFNNYQGVRIQTSDRYHLLRIGTELTYPKGVVFFRVRGVGKLLPEPPTNPDGSPIDGYEPNYDEAVTVKGEWITNPYFIRLSDPADPSRPNYTPPVTGGYQVARIKHEPKRNWQYATTFAEEGKYKKVMSYFNSSLRQNQTLTNFTTDREEDGVERSITLVEEHFTDYEGRGVIQTIPAPLATASLTYQTAIGGQTSGTDPERINFFGTTATSDDQNPDNVLHTKSAYDKDHRNGVVSAPLALGSLTREYYGVADRQHHLLTPFNDAIHDKYIPESNGYAYTQVKYTNDGTGRIKAQSGVGETFAMGNGREVKYFYLTPTEKELTRLFGTDIGDVSHYKKVLSIDPNGQKSVAYIDQAGQTIATGLVGESPEMLRALDNTISEIEINLNKSNKRSDTKSETRHTFYNPLPETVYTFKYDMEGAMTEFENLDQEVFCRVCTYELRIYLLDAQGNKIALSSPSLINPTDEYIREIKPNSDDNTNNDYDEASEDRPDWCEEADNELINTVKLNEIVLSANLDEGEYTFIKELVLTAGDGTTFQSFVDSETETDEFEERTLAQAQEIADENCTYCADYIDEDGNLVSIGNGQDCPEIIESLEDFATNLANFECETIWQTFMTNEDNAQIIADNELTLENPLTGVGAVCYDACALLTPSREYDIKMNSIKSYTEGETGGTINFTDPFDNDPFWQIFVDNVGGSINDLEVEWNNYEITAGYNIQILLNGTGSYQDIDNDPTLTTAQKEEEKDKRKWVIFSGGYQHFKRAKMRLFYLGMQCSEENTNAILPDQDPSNDLLDPNNTNYNDQKNDALDAFGSTADCEEWARIKAESLVVGAYGEDASCQGWNTMTQTQRTALIDLLVPHFIAYCEGNSEDPTIAMDNQFRKLYYDQSCDYPQLVNFFAFVENNPNNTDPYGASIINIENNVLVENPTVTNPVITSYRLVKWFASFIENASGSLAETEHAFKAHFDRQEPQAGADPANPFHYTEAEWNNLAPSIILAYIELSIRATTDDNCSANSQEETTNNALTNIKTDIGLYAQQEGIELCLTPFYAMLSPIACRAYEEEIIRIRKPDLVTYTYSNQQFLFNDPVQPLILPYNQNYDNLLNNNFTIDILAKPDLRFLPQGDELRMLSSNIHPTENGHTYFSFGIKEVGNNTYKLYFYYNNIEGSTPREFYATSESFGSNTYSCSRFTFEKDNDNIGFFLDGVSLNHTIERENISPSQMNGSLSNTQLYIGDQFKGVIQEVRVWNSTNDPVVGNYSQLPSQYHSRNDLIGYWKLQLDPNNEILDYSLERNHIPYNNSAQLVTDQNCVSDLTDYEFEDKTVRVCSEYDDNFSDLSTHYTMDDVMAACVEETIEEANEEIISIRREQRTVLSNRLDEKYNNDCFKSPFKENLTMTYTSSEHHYTLYYYDQAGNLYQTVPPEGVDKTWNANHTLKTEYHYNTLGQVVWQKTPDGGESQMWVDYYGRVRLSQNQEQNTLHADRGDTHFEYAYSKYDDLGRPYEAGKISILPNAQGNDPLTTVAIDELVFSNNFPEQVTAANIIAPTDENSQATIPLSFELSERTVTYYDNAQMAHPEGDYIVNPTEQHYLRNRVAAVAVYEEGTTIGAVTRYSYDIHGNVENVWQRLPRIAISANTEEDVILPEKNVSYIYDLLSGKVNQVVYQEGTEDEFRHRYDYDGDNRLTRVNTSHDGIHWTLEARYFYYAHGPLARVEVGEHNIQGVDYYYTLQGWIKGVNSPEGTFGEDGTENNPSFNADEFAYTLHYFEGDYKARGTNSILGDAFNKDADYNNFRVSANNEGFVGFTDQISSVNYNRESLYNGNVAAMTTSIKHFGDAGQEATQSMNYRYDQLHRIAAANAMTWDGTKWEQQGDRYQTAYKYDGNGNIQNLQRRNQAGQVIDKLKYSYDPVKKNQLYSVKEEELGSAADKGLGNANHVYRYDEIGNLIKNTSDGIQNIVWNIQGKVEQVTRGTGANETVISYRYDASGNRITKQVATTTTNHINYYLRDASGNVMAIYEYDKKPENTHQATIQLKEIPIYGGSRLGQYRMSYSTIEVEGTPTRIKDKSTALGQRVYEFSNHLQNVLVVLADFKVPVTDGTTTSFKAIVVSANDYYPFGMVMEGRKYYDPNYDYRYGFNGKEDDKDFGDKQLIQDYGFRLYNPAIAKFLSVDPLAPDYPELTVYQFASNTPIWAIDLDGLESATATVYGELGYRILTKFGGFGGAGTAGIGIAVVWNHDKGELEYGIFRSIGIKGSYGTPGVHAAFGIAISGTGEHKSMNDVMGSSFSAHLLGVGLTINTSAHVGNSGSVWDKAVGAEIVDISYQHDKLLENKNGESLVFSSREDLITFLEEEANGLGETFNIVGAFTETLNNLDRKVENMRNFHRTGEYELQFGDNKRFGEIATLLGYVGVSDMYQGNGINAALLNRKDSKGNNIGYLLGYDGTPGGGRGNILKVNSWWSREGGRKRTWFDNMSMDDYEEKNYDIETEKQAHYWFWNSTVDEATYNYPRSN